MKVAKIFFLIFFLSISTAKCQEIKKAGLYIIDSGKIWEYQEYQKYQSKASDNTNEICTENYYLNKFRANLRSPVQNDLKSTKFEMEKIALLKSKESSTNNLPSRLFYSDRNNFVNWVKNHPNPSSYEPIDQGLNSVLHWAVYHDEIELCKKLLKNGFPVDAQGEWQKTALFWAAKKGNKNTIALLLRYGASSNAKSSYGLTPFDEALLSGKKEAFHQLVEHSEVIPGINKSLRCAAETGLLEECKFLIEKGANPRQCDGAKANLLHAVVKSKNLELIKYFIELGVPVNETDVNGFSCLFNAIDHDNSAEVLKFLKESGGKLDLADKSGYSLIYWATSRGNPKIVKFLLENGANPNDKSFDGSLLATAANWKDKELIELLRSHGAK